MSVSIPVVLGTGREERWSEHVARLVHAHLAARDGINTELIDVRDHLTSPFTIPAWVEDERPSKWRKIASEAAGFVFVVPEYNHSFPGEFKLLFDSAFKEYAGKPASIVGVSDGQFGGVRMMQQLMPVLHTAKMYVAGTVVATAYVDKLFKTGETDDEKYLMFVERMLDELITMTNAHNI